MTWLTWRNFNIWGAEFLFIGSLALVGYSRIGEKGGEMGGLHYLGIGFAVVATVEFFRALLRRE
jgi:hypothetical protein